MIICAIYDKKAMLYEQPFFAVNTNHAVRGFAMEIKKPGSSLGMFADDFELHQIGKWENNFTENVETEPLEGNPKVQLVTKMKITKKAEFENMEPRIIAIGSAFKPEQKEN